MKSNMLSAARGKILFAMTLFGTIGLFVRAIPLPSSAIALFRAVISVIFLCVFVAVRGQRFSKVAIRRNFPLLCLSGVAIGINWILLFEAYRYTTVATATICYYLAPVLVILAAPFALGERLTRKKVFCVLLALVGTGILSGGADVTSLRGVLCGIGAAAFYACVMILNKKLKDISEYERTTVQLAAAAAALLPYVLLTQKPQDWQLHALQVVLLLVVGVVHTGIAYSLYFDAMGKLPVQSTAIYSYLDPLVAVVLSAVVLREPFGVREAMGALLILVSTLWSEVDWKKRKAVMDEDGSK